MPIFASSRSGTRPPSAVGTASAPITLGVRALRRRQPDAHRHQRDRRCHMLVTTLPASAVSIDVLRVVDRDAGARERRAIELDLQLRHHRVAVEVEIDDARHAWRAPSFACSSVVAHRLEVGAEDLEHDLAAHTATPPLRRCP